MAQISTKGSIDVELPVDIFDVQVNIPLIHQVVVAQLAAARQGTHSTKNRGEVAGGGCDREPFWRKLVLDIARCHADQSKRLARKKRLWAR